MAFLLQVKERAVTTDSMFEPMRGTIDLLKFFDMDIPEEVNVSYTIGFCYMNVKYLLLLLLKVLLQELPEQWNNTKKLAVTVKQQVAPLQATEVVSIRNRIANFDLHINVFRDMFRTYEFFKYDCDDPYTLLDRISDDIYRLENEMAAINESGSLFEVNVPEFKLLKQCRRELKMLKVLKCNALMNGIKMIKSLFITATLGLCLHRTNVHRRLENNSLEKNWRREHGHWV